MPWHILNIFVLPTFAISSLISTGDTTEDSATVKTRYFSDHNIALNKTVLFYVVATEFTQLIFATPHRTDLPIEM